MARVKEIEREPAPIDSMYFPPLTVETIGDEGLDNLRIAIVKNAADDYKDECKAEIETTVAKVLQGISAQKAGLEHFFRSDWFKLLTNNQIDSEWMIKNLRQKAREEWEDDQQDDGQD